MKWRSLCCWEICQTFYTLSLSFFLSFWWWWWWYQPDEVYFLFSCSLSLSFFIFSVSVITYLINHKSREQVERRISQINVYYENDDDYSDRDTNNGKRRSLKFSLALVFIFKVERIMTTRWEEREREHILCIFFLLTIKKKKTFVYRVKLSVSDFSCEFSRIYIVSAINFCFIFLLFVLCFVCFFLF